VRGDCQQSQVPEDRFMKLKPHLLILPVAAAALCVALPCAIRTASKNVPAARAQPANLTYQVHGNVRAVDRAGGIVKIAHDAIPDYMPAMTMEFPVKDTPIPKGLAAGDQIQFELSVTETDSWISHIAKIIPDGAAPPGENSASAVPADTDATELHTGETVPDFELIDQNGKPVRVSKFRGRPVVLTFIYTRCPLPNYCPLMSKNFQSLQQRLNKELSDKFQLLSVTIDPAFDRPEILKDYARRYAADEKCWTFTTGSREQIDTVANLFGLVHEPESGLISHNLRTALIGPDGRLRHVWKSNVWTPYEVARMVGETLAEPKTLSDARRL
jgi:protein SCO1/2